MLVTLYHVQEEILEADKGQTTLTILFYLIGRSILLENLHLKLMLVHHLIVNAITERFKFLIVEFLMSECIKLVENVFHCTFEQRCKYWCFVPCLCELVLVPAAGV